MSVIPERVNVPEVPRTGEGNADSTIAGQMRIEGEAGDRRLSTEQLRSDAKKAAQVALVWAGLYLLLNLIVSHMEHENEATQLLSAIPWLLLTWGIYKMWRSAAVIALLLYIVQVLAAFVAATALRIFSSRTQAGNWVFWIGAVVLALGGLRALVVGISATFEYRRQSQRSPMPKC